MAKKQKPKSHPAGGREDKAHKDAVAAEKEAGGPAVPTEASAAGGKDVARSRAQKREAGAKKKGKK